MENSKKSAVPEVTAESSLTSLIAIDGKRYGTVTLKYGYTGEGIHLVGLETCAITIDVTCKTTFGAKMYSAVFACSFARKVLEQSLAPFLPEACAPQFVVSDKALLVRCQCSVLAEEDILGTFYCIAADLCERYAGGAFEEAVDHAPSEMGRVVFDVPASKPERGAPAEIISSCEPPRIPLPEEEEGSCADTGT